MATCIIQACAEDECWDLWVRDGSFDRLVILEIVVFKDTRHLERLRGLEVVVVMVERHPDRAS